MAHRILTVCTGNICRSPTAEQLLVAHLTHHNITVTSAGTHAMVGSPMPAPARLLSTLLGGRGAEEHRGVQLTADQIREADLVLAMDRQHRRAVVELHPPASRYCFTLLEFAHIVGQVTDDDVAEATQHASAGEVGGAVPLGIAVAGTLRGVVPPLDQGEEYDVVDPYLASDAVYEHSADVIEVAVLRIARFLDHLAGRTA